MVQEVSHNVDKCEPVQTVAYSEVAKEAGYSWLPLELHKAWADQVEYYVGPIHAPMVKSEAMVEWIRHRVLF